ncbi:MAG: universal stress protein [Chloroflexi bacterium]|nr:universal stress protein [Chloroflexota bacterium]
MFRHLIVPLDGSREANVGVPHAYRIARGSGARVTLLRVVSHGRDVADGQAFLDGVAHEYAAPDLAIEVVVREGDAAEVILSEIQQRGADLVVMRTHGRSGLTRAVLGSVAEKIVKQSSTPVLLLPPGDRNQASGDIRAILVPVDGSPGGSLALGVAQALARQSNASLQLLQVVQPVPAYQSSALLMYGPMDVDPAWDADAESGAQAHVDAIASRLSARGLTARAEALIANSVPEAIVTNAAEHECDLIVMSSHAHTGAARAFLGSVTDAVVRSAKCPVLVVRREAERESQPGEAA